MRGKWVRGLVATLAIALVLLLGGVWWLFCDSGPAPSGLYPLDLSAIRAEASRPPGAPPDRIEVEIVSHSAVPRIAMAAGPSWAKVALVRASYRLVAPGRSLIVDTGYDAAGARNAQVDSFDPVARAHILAALDAADGIVVTHEHGDHLGGVTTSPHLARLLPHLWLTREQLGSASGPSWPAGVARPRPLVYGALHAIAPGVVLIKAPGHTPGSQMVYVRLASGREYLFMGDTASLADNVLLQHQRSRYVTRFVSGDDRAAVAAQLQAIGALHRLAPGLVLVPGHDGPTIAALIAHGALAAGFGNSGTVR